MADHLTTSGNATSNGTDKSTKRVNFVTIIILKQRPCQPFKLLDLESYYDR